MDSLEKVILDWVSKQQAFLNRSQYDRPQSQIKVVLDSNLLATARTQGNPFEIQFPFKSVFVSDATDSSVAVNISLHSRENNQIQNAVPLKLNDSFRLSESTSKAFLTWDAQSGKSITLFFFVDSQYDSGRQISVSSGGVAITWGDTVTETQKTLVAVTAQALFASVSTRKHGAYQNKSGASIWVGSSSSVTSSGATQGFEIPDNAIAEWKSAAALYAYSVAGGIVNVKDFT